MRVNGLTNPLNRIEGEFNPYGKHFLAFEGAQTEGLYFREAIKKSSIYNDIYVLSRNEEVLNASNPKLIVNMIENSCNKFSLSLTYESISYKLYEYISNSISYLDFATFNSMYYDTLTNLNISIYDVISLDKLTIILKLVFSYLNDIYNINVLIEKDNISNILNNKFTYDKVLDKIYLVVDRDKHSFTVEQYDYVLNARERLNMDVFITTPCFEFYLLMHFDNMPSFDKYVLFNNSHVGNTKQSYSFSLLKKMDKTYRKNNYNTKYYITNIKKAITNSKLFESDIYKLKYQIGTNIPSLLDLLKIKY